MPIEKEKQGMALNEFNSKLKNNTSALRVGKEVPEGDVNLAYIHVPAVDSDENISLIDTSYTSDNVITQDQGESIVVANAQGELEYVDFIGNGEVRSRPPENIFPSSKVNITRQFKKSGISIENALFYKFEIDFHYDSKVAIPDSSGNYPLEKYTGQQIELTDENGNLLGDDFKHDIYVQAQPLNPRIYSVRVYLQTITSKSQSIKIRYNHIDKVVKNNEIQAVKQNVELYTEKDNIVIANGVSRQMLEGGKLRIVNGVSAFEEATEAEVKTALVSANEKEIYAAIPQDGTKGYKIMVPQKSEYDPRSPSIFAHRILAKYTGDDGQEVTVTVGHITESCMNSSALLKGEQGDYTNDWKNIGLIAGGGKLNARQMIELSMPFGTPSLPAKAKLSIEDDKAALMYDVTTLSDNPDIETKVNMIMSEIPEAKFVGAKKQNAWTNAMQENAVVKNIPIKHQVTIIPERQMTSWPFKWKANGEGYTNQKNKNGSVTQVPWKTSTNGLTVNGTGTVTYHPDGHYTVVVDPAVLPSDQIPSEVIGFKWTPPQIVSGDNVNISISGSDVVTVTADPPPITAIGKRYVLDEREILKSDGIKHLEYLFKREDETGFYSKLGIPSDVPRDEIMLRIERGEVASIASDGTATVNNPEYRVNYRFRCQKKGFTRFPVDQFQDQLGVNRLRLSSILNDSKQFDPNVVVDLVAWTSFEELEMVPIFAVKIDEQKKIKLEKPKVAQDSMEVDNWYLRVKNGKFLKRVVLPYFERNTGAKIPEIYTAYPQLLGMVSSPKDVVEVDLEYTLPEYADQEFQNSPHVIVDKEKPIILNDYSIQTRYAPIALSSKGNTSYIDVYSIRGNQRRQLRVSDVDAAKGIIFLLDRIREQDEVYIKYAYQEEYFTYRGFYKEKAEYVTTPVAKEVTTTVNLKIEASGKKEVSEFVKLPSQSLFNIDGFGAYGIDIYPAAQGIGPGKYKAGESSLYWEESRELYDIYDDSLKFLIYGTMPELRQPDVVLNDVRDYFVKHKKSGLFLLNVNVWGGESEGRVPEIVYQNEIIKDLGIELKRASNLPTDIKINTDHPSLKSYDAKGLSLPYSPNGELVISNPKIKPIAWAGADKKHVIFAILEDGDQKILFIANAGPMFPYRDMNAWQFVMDPLVTSIFGHMSDYIDTKITEEKKTFGPITKTIKKTYTSGKSITEECFALSISPSIEFGSTWSNFVSTYKGYDLKLTPVISQYSSGESLSKSELLYGDGTEIGKREMSSDDTFKINNCIRLMPVIERRVLESTFFHLDLNPTPGHRHTVAENGFHRWIPTNTDTETYTLQAAGTDNKELLVKPIHIYMRPSAIRTVALDGSKGGDIIPETTLNRTVFHTDEECWFNPKDYKYDPTMFRLGKVLLQANSTIQDDMTILDTRTRGGGLDESLSREIIRQVNKESLYHWDIGYFDGEAYQENGVVVIKVPRTVLKSESNPNGFHESEVQEAVAKHKAYGVLPIIEYYDSTPDEYKYNLISNSEFLYNKDLGYFDPSNSSGNYEIIHLPIGAGDNYVLSLKDKAEYAVTIPGYKFKEPSYRIDIKGMKQVTASARSIGEAQIFYKNGSSKTIPLSKVTRDQWIVYKNVINVGEDVHHVRITLNKSSETRAGEILVDYVTIIPIPSIEEDTTEVHEI
ncbi:hypothetical protein ACWA2C_16985 [Priestia megaterium]